MAFYQIILFRKKAYIRKIDKKYANADDRRAHAENIICKRKQIADATWGIYTGLLLSPITAGVSVCFSVLHLRNNHIARQKLNALESLYKKKYGKTLPEVKLTKANFAKKCIIFIVQPIFGTWGIEYVIGDTDGKFDFEKELGEVEEEKESEMDMSGEGKKAETDERDGSVTRA